MQRGKSPLLPSSFYQRDALDVARDLLGKLLKRDEVILRISEVEAYRWPDDSACHNRFGRTARNAAMWGPGGRVYVYLCYGVHQMLNVVTNPTGEAAAVLIRACEVVEGLEQVRARRGMMKGPVLLTGPGKVGAALGLDVTWSGHPLFRKGGLELRDGAPPAALLVGPRVGIDYAQKCDRDAPWRLAIAGSDWVSLRKSLMPEPPKRRRRSSSPTL